MSQLLKNYKYLWINKISQLYILLLQKSTKVVNMNKTKSKAAKELLSEKERKYDCKECGKQLSNMGNLNAHIRAAHERVKYPCQQCLYKTTTKGSLEKHRRSVHEGKQAQESLAAVMSLNSIVTSWADDCIETTDSYLQLATFEL